MARALKKNVCSTTPGEMKLRCQYLTGRLGLSNESLTRVSRNLPTVLLRQPACLETNLRRLEDLCFSSSQVQSMATRRPNLLLANWDTALRKETWHVLTNIMRIPLERLERNPVILIAGMHLTLSRWQFLCLLANAGQLKSSRPIDILCNSVAYSDKKFVEALNCSGMDLAYDKSFKTACLAGYFPKFVNN